MKKIVVAGTGYVGLVTGVCLAHHGHSVTCLDLDAAKIGTLCAGQSPIYEPGLTELLQEGIAAGRLRFTTSVDAYRDAEVIFIGVGTPEREDGSANLDYVFAAVKQIALSLERDCVVVVKSTVPIGTNDEVERYLKEHLAHPVQVDVASNPEFLAQGTAVRDTLHASRIVIGTESERPRRVLEEVYADFDAPRLFTSRRSAEMIKYASNDFLALKISYINEIANLCEQVGANVDDVALGMGYDERIGKHFLRAGIGYGGSCFPKDTKALDSFATIKGVALKTVAATIAVNEGQKRRLLEKARAHYPSLAGVTAAVLGLAFKPGTDDLREAPSLLCLPQLLAEGACIRAWDPVAAKNFARRLAAISPAPGAENAAGLPAQKAQGSITYCDTIEQALAGAELCLIFTEWPEVRALAPQTFEALMETPIVLDGRNCFAPDAIRGSGARLRYESIGRPPVDTREQVPGSGLQEPAKSPCMPEKLRRKRSAPKANSAERRPQDMPPLVSIITPAYNVADYLPECLASFLPDAEALGYELILVDDGSSDATGSLCDEYAARHSFVRAMHQANAGQSAARNAAIRAAAGEWLVFVDSDDTLAPGALRTIDAALRAAPPETDLLLYNIYSAANGGVTAPFLTAQFADGLEGYLARVVREYPFSAALCRYAPRRDLFTEQGLWLHEGIYHEDSEWCPRALARARAAAVCEDALYLYRDTADAGHESTMLSPARREKRLASLGAVREALQAEAGSFARDSVRHTFLLRCAALCGFQRLLLAGRCGVLEETCREDMDTMLYDLEDYLPRRFALCVRLVGLKWGVRLYRRLWGDC